jgi:hypothetical protein
MGLKGERAKRRKEDASNKKCRREARKEKKI